LRELTIRAVILGVILSVVMAMANTYLGLYAGMTVSASIPAAVISMAILRGLMRKGTILENNIVQTAASAGESLAAGIIFTIPALIIIGAWKEFNYFTTFIIGTLGGILGVIFMIPMRKVLIVEKKELKYPEGVACAQVLEAGDRGGTGAKLIFLSLLGGFVYKFLSSALGLIKGTIEGAVRIGKSIFYAGSDLSVALLGIGYLVGFNVSVLVFIGGFIGWVIGIPIYSALHPATGHPLDIAWTLWSGKVRFIGVGAMIVGGIWSIINIREGIKRGLQGIFRTFEEHTEDLERKHLLPILALTIIGVFFVYLMILKHPGITLLATISMVIASFFFVAVSSYIVGLVGSSNNPVSGMVISSLLFSALIIGLSGIRGIEAMIATLLVAGVVSCATCTAGDVSQDLKTGYLVGASPRRQQIVQILGVLSGALVIPFVLKLLHHAYGIGTGKPGALQAPQASLFASLTKGIFSKGMGLEWDMITAGIILGIFIILIDLLLKKKHSDFRLHIMPVAVGIYLPFSLSIPILLGGIISRFARNKENGTLISSGLIAGESIAGVVVAGMIYGGFKTGILPSSTIMSLILFAIPVIFLLIAKGKNP